MRVAAIGHDHIDQPRRRVRIGHVDDEQHASVAIGWHKHIELSAILGLDEEFLAWQAALGHHDLEVLRSGEAATYFAAGVGGFFLAWGS